MAPRRRLVAPLLAAAAAVACVAAEAGAPPANVAGARWPSIPPRSQRIVLRASQVAAVPLADAHGRPAYLLECREAAGAIVHCGLRDLGQRAGPSLLVRTGLRDRGLFRERDLAGACAAYPQYGRQRSFRLRGFELSLALLDVPAAAAGVPPGHALQLDLQPDPLATASEAELPDAPDPESPGHSCQAPPPAADPFACRKPEVEVAKPSCTQ